MSTREGLPEDAIFKLRSGTGNRPHVEVCIRVQRSRDERQLAHLQRSGGLAKARTKKNPPRRNLGLTPRTVGDY